MAQFFGIVPGQSIEGEGIRIEVRRDGEAVWMHGKWLDLGEDHGVVVFKGTARFIRPDGHALSLGSFPAWVVRGKGKSPVIAAMFSKTQFVGGHVVVNSVAMPVTDASLQVA